jgi:mRNA interferase MazF
VIVVQSDDYNSSRLQTVVVVSLTRNRGLASMPGNVLVPAEFSGLTDDAIANVTQIGAVDKQELDLKVGSLPSWLLDDIDDGVRRVLAL